MRYKTSDTIRKEQAEDGNSRIGEDTTERPGCAMPYVDDIAVHTVGGEDKHLRDLDMLLGRLHAFDCRLSASKCKFFHKKIEFLGHIVSKHGLEADPKKVAAVEAITVDRMKKPKDLKVFLHTVGYMRKFIKNFAARAAPMSKYLKKGAKMKAGLEGDQEALDAFHDLRACLLAPPILAHPDWAKPFEVHCDGSKQGLGAALIQRGEKRGGKGGNVRQSHTPRSNNEKTQRRRALLCDLRAGESSSFVRTGHIQEIHSRKENDSVLRPHQPAATHHEGSRKSQQVGRETDGIRRGNSSCPWEIARTSGRTIKIPSAGREPVHTTQ